MNLFDSYKSVIDSHRLRKFITQSFILRFKLFFNTPEKKIIFIGHRDFELLANKHLNALIRYLEETKLFLVIEYHNYKSFKTIEIHEVVKFLDKYEVIQKQVFFSFLVSKENCIFADDVMNEFPSKYLNKIFYDFDCSLLNDDLKSKNSKFHFLMFLEKMSRHKSLGVGHKVYYENMAYLLESEQSPNEYFIKNSIGLDKFKNNFSFIEYFKDLSSDLKNIKKNQRFLKLIGLSNKNLIKSIFNIFQKNYLLATKNVNTQVKSLSANKNLKDKVSPRSWKKILITGWYGTETIGDKAILGELLYFINKCSPNCKIIITSINDRIINQTKREIDLLKNAETVKIDKASESKLIQSVDAIIIGGGPLMESSRMYNLFNCFLEGRKQNKQNIIFGCGLGPIHSKKIEIVTRRILMLTSAGFVRDKESYLLASQLFSKHNLEVACDPAFAYIRRWRLHNIVNRNTKPKKNKIGLLLRENTKEFRNSLKDKDLESMNENFALGVSKLISSNLRNFKNSIHLLYMNAPWIGGDDRLFNRKLIKNIDLNDNVRIYRDYHTLDQQIENISDMTVTIAMRYHGHIFSIALGIPFVSIDYTGKNGKVSSLLNRIDYTNRSYLWEQIVTANELEKIKTIDGQRNKISKKLLLETDRLVSKLYRTYETVFNVNLD